MSFEGQMANTPEGYLQRKQLDSRRAAGSFEDHAADYANQAEVALAGNGPAAILARTEIAQSNISPQWPTKDGLIALANTLDKLKPSVLESIPKEELERLAFTLALVSAHSKSLH